ncbi:CHAT domain-containing protein [Zavarzinia sp. CC-PAN008]|uniref:CHAT domain-containing protein n=1 Tax=Zavarzinia sp. CC-PAN008 TaxID=3243332 RepID=UPI003F743249
MRVALARSLALAVMLVLAPYHAAAQGAAPDPLVARFQAAHARAVQGAHAEAEVLHRDLLQAVEAAGRGRTGLAAAILLDLAIIASRTQRPLEARTLALRAGETGLAAADLTPTEQGQLARECARLLAETGEHAAALPYARGAARLLADSPQAGEAGNALALALLAVGHAVEAQTVLQDLEGRLAAGASPGFLAVLAGNRVEANIALGRGQAALAAARDALAWAAADAGQEARAVAGYAQAAALAYTGDRRGAEQTLAQVIADLRAAGQERSTLAANAAMLHGRILFDRGLYLEAEPYLRTAVALYEAASAPAGLAQALHALGNTYQALARLDDAARHLDRAAQVLGASLGPEATQTLATRIERAGLDTMMGFAGPATDAAARIIAALDETTAPRGRLLGLAHALKGLALLEKGHESQAAAAFEMAIALLDRHGGARNPDAFRSLIELGRIRTRQGQVAQAQPLLDRAVSDLERDATQGSWKLPYALSARSELGERSGRVAAALADARHASAVLADRPAGSAADSISLGESARRVARRLFAAHAGLALRLAAQATGADRQALVAEGFAIGQRAQASSPGRAIARTGARMASADAGLESIVRAREEALEQQAALEQAQRDLLVEAAVGDRAALEAALAAARARRAALDRQLAQAFPAFAHLVDPQPVALARARALLDADEALLFHVQEEDAANLWWLSRDHAVAVRVDLPRAELERLVGDLRRGLDLTGGGGLRAYDVATARRLHDLLLGPFPSQRASARRLLVVPDGALQSLPLSVLVGSDPTSGSAEAPDYARLDWLGRRVALTTLPSVGALEVMRTTVRPSRADQPFFGIGDPDFAGRTRPAPEAAPAEGGAPSRGPDPRRIYRGDRAAMRAEIARLSPLPETAIELEAARHAFGGDRRTALLLGADATESRLRATPLDRFRILMFSTHAMVAGDFEGLTEPALVLAPDPAAGATDDGLLTMSEAAGLRLDAVLTILSACNTAAPDGTPGADGLSGLAEAFLLAGSRAMVVSHWPVASDATAELMRVLVREMAAGASVPAALAQAQASLTSGPDPQYAHPAFWAPFVVVGAGR